ncbi:hypothetical protein [Nonomuraea guangzhouensis]|uniref:Integrase n=1 Tax=Nonomuraea guangzhouensis TaxID=1291555 RepID=A0ABW4GXQ5_9ACTN|nr:hypothetical protein [Nonomuraea guangzhouensis]
MTPQPPKRSNQSDAAALDEVEELSTSLSTIAPAGRLRARLLQRDPHSGPALDETLVATAAWLANKDPDIRADQLGQLRSWLRHCEREHVHPLRAQVWDVIRWLDSLAPGRTPTAVPSALASLRSWYSQLHHRGICASHPAADLCRAPTVAAHEPSGTHGVSASATLVDYAEGHAVACGDETEWNETNWRDAALIAIWFHTAIAPPALLDLDLAELQWKPGTTHAPERGAAWHGDHERDRVPLAGQPARLLVRYLTRRAARQRLPLEQLLGPLLATAPLQRTPDQRLTDMEVINILARFAPECGLPPRAGLTPCPTGHTDADHRPAPRTIHAPGDADGEPSGAPLRWGALTIKSHRGDQPIAGPVIS